MSFLMRGKKVFLFVFFVYLFLGFFNINQSLAANDSNLGGTDPTTTSKTEQTINNAQNQQSAENESAPTAGDMGMNLITGALAAIGKVVSPLVAVVSILFFTITSLLVGFTSYIFNFAIEIGILGISQLANSEAVKLAWEVFRNLGNITLVFILLYIAVNTILGAGGYKSKELLGKVIIAAVLMNFSFLFGAIIVDVSNVISLNVYDEIQKTTGAQDTQNTGLGGYFFKKSGAAVLWLPIIAGVDKNASVALSETISKGAFGFATGGIWGGIASIFTGSVENFFDITLLYAVGFSMGTLINIVLAVVLAIASFMILARLITILFLLAVAPIAFVSRILPATEKTSKEWWDSIIGQAFFLPVFLLFIWISVKIIGLMSDPSFISNALTSQLSNGGSTGGSGFFSLSETIKLIIPAAFQFLLVIGFLLASVTMAKKVADKTSGLAGKISASVTSNVGGAVIGTGAFLGRNTIGAAANRMANSETLKNMADTSPRVAAFIKTGLQGGAKKTFDARESKIFKGVASATGVNADFGKAAKDGFKGQSDRMTAYNTKLLATLPSREDDHADVVTARNTLEKAKAETQEEIKKYKKAVKDFNNGNITQAQFDQSAEDLRNKRKAEKKAEDEVIKTKNPGQAKLAEKLKDSTKNPTKIQKVTNFWLGDSRKDTAKKVMDSLKKSSIDKRFDSIEKLLKEKSNP